MPSGKALSQQDIAYIAKHMETKSPKQIARQLGLNRNTVSMHIKRLESRN